MSSRESVSLAVPRFDEVPSRDSESRDRPGMSRAVSGNNLLAAAKLTPESPVLAPQPRPAPPPLLDNLKSKSDFLRCSQRANMGFFAGKRKEYTAYHVIANRVLTYYGSDSKLDPLGSFPLLDASLAVENREDKTFLCLRPVGCGLVHVMEVPPLDKDDWIETFRRHGVAARVPILEEWLWKTGSKMTRWHRRKFIFFEDSIDYFKLDADEKEMGSIPLLPSLQVKKLPENVGNVGDGESPASFCVSYRTAAEEREYYINATSEAQRDRWIAKIKDIMAQPVTRKLQNSVFEGYLYKSTGRDAWQRMYAVLNDMDLAFYKTKYEGVPSATIPLSVTSEANPQDRGALSTFVLWEKGDEGSKTHLIRCADDQTTLMWARAINQHFSAKLVKKNPDSLKEGYLVLCPPPESSGIFEGQRRHFFVLVKHFLLYYKKRDDVKPAGEIAMSGNAFVYLEQSNVSDKSVFSCAPSGDEGSKKTHLQCKDALQRVEWVNVLVENIKTMRTKKVEDSVMEGYMFLATGLKITKRFFVLTQNSLDWYKKRADTTRQGGVDLLPESEALFEDEEKGEFLFSVAASGDEGSKKTAISCYSETDQSKWVQAINDIIEAKNVKLNPQSVKEGYLWKDNSSHNYNKRYFVLLSDKMLYYAKRKDAVEAGKEKGTIPLPGGTQVDRVPEANNVKRGKVFPFNVIPCGDEGARVYALEACSSKGRDLWIDAIMSVLPKNSQVNSFSVLEGYLNKSDGKGKNWHKRYCVLWQDKLLYYKQKPVGDPLEHKESGCIDITYDSSVVEGGSDLKMSFMFQVCPSGDEGSRRYFMQAEDEAMMNKWVETITTLIEKRPQEKRDPESLMEEFISMSNNGGSFRKRYCCLYSDRVVVYANKADKREYMSVELTANTFIAMQDSKIGIFHLGQDYLCKLNDAKKGEKWMITILRLCSKMKKVPLFGGTLNDGCYLSPRKVPLLCYEIVMHLLPKVMEMTNLQKGDKEIVATIQQQYEEGKKVDLSQYAWNDVLDVLVLYLKEIGTKSSLIGPRVAAELEKFLKPKSFLIEDVSAIRSALMKLDENRLLLTRWILFFLSTIARSKSRMTAELCAMRFAPVMVDCVPIFDTPVSPTAIASPRKTSNLPWRSDVAKISSSHNNTNSGDFNARKSSVSASFAITLDTDNSPVSPTKTLSRESVTGATTVGSPSNSANSSPSATAKTLTTAALDSGEDVPLAGRVSRAGSVASGLSEHATKIEVGQRIITNLIEFYDELFPGGIPKTYRGRGQQLHHWVETRDENGKIVYYNTQTKLKQTEVPGPFKKNATDWTFGDILLHKAGLDRMHAFARNAHNAENLEFYLAVKEFREADFEKDGSNGKPARPESLVESAFALYRKFVGADAVSQVNIGDKLRLPLDAIFASGTEDVFRNLTPEQQRDIFTAAQAEVYRLVETNDFRNFVKSPEFKEHLAALAESLT